MPSNTNKMEVNRLALHNKLIALFSSTSAAHVYYQPPTNLTMVYPCIVYSRSNIDNKHGDNLIYAQDYIYSVTVVSKNPDEPIADLASRLPGCKFNRTYVADGLNHYTYTIYNN